MKNILYFTLLVFLVSCRDDIDTLTVETIEDPIIILVESGLKGQVVDEAGSPLPFAKITVNERVVTTNSNGRFEFKNIEVKKNGGNVVSAKLEGYFEGISHSNFSAGSSSFVEITMIPKDTPLSLNAANGGTIVNDDNLSITFPQNALRTINNEIYNGNADVHSKWIDPTAENMASIMPGALIATSEDGEALALASYGMLALEIEDDNGMPLELAEGQELDIELPIPNELLDEAPDEIPLWFFDIEEDQWVLKGECKKINSTYSFKITSSGFWNCDIALPAICLSGNIFNADSTFASYLKVEVEDLTDNFIYFGYTDINGFFCGSVPQASNLVLRVIDHCNNIIYESNIGPFSQDTQLEDIYLDELIETFLFNISGSVDNCDMSLFDGGYLSVEYPSSIRIYPFENNIFDVNVAFKCSDFPEVNILAHSLSTNMSTETMTLTTQEDVIFDNELTCHSYEDFMIWSTGGESYTSSPSRFHFKSNTTTNWLVLEAYNALGEIKLEVRDYSGVGLYNSGVFLTTASETNNPNQPLINLSSPEVQLNITSDDGLTITGSLTGNYIDNNGDAQSINIDLRVKKSI